ncbi:restriction endonuclease subunit S [Roseateles chitinivorans]|uniref:restriction endonuclease subunit S n=1 Tax=Roseateles chitinivorans TaxID=2917965 RepID=UPI003D67471C
MKTGAMKDQTTPALVPKLRFPEFRNEDAWQVKPLNKLLFEPKKRNRDLELGPADVLSVSGEHGCVNQIEFMGRSYAGASVKDYHVVEHGDVVYTKSPLKKNPFGIIKANKGKRGIVSTLYAVYRPFPDCSATYVDHFFSGDYNLNAYLQPLVKKGAKNDMKVNNTDVLKGNICVPKLPEQQKIADCLDSLDELIAAQGRKVESLKTHKRGLMQQLFPREGKNQPRLRFPEFRDAGVWEKKPLSEFILSLDGGVSVNAGDSRPANKSELGVLKTSAITRGAFDPEENKVVLDKSELSRLREPVTAGTIIMCRKNTPALVGAIAYVDTTHDNLYLPDLLWAAKPKEGVSMRFLACILGSDEGRATLLKLAKGSSASMSNITKPEVLAMSVTAPSPAEQRRIADCLSSIDTLITAATQVLEVLKTHKLGLMQQLFPSAEALEA